MKLGYSLARSSFKSDFSIKLWNGNSQAWNGDIQGQKWRWAHDNGGLKNIRSNGWVVWLRIIREDRRLEVKLMGEMDVVVDACISPTWWCLNGKWRRLFRSKMGVVKVVLVAWGRCCMVYDEGEGKLCYDEEEVDDVMLKEMCFWEMNGAWNAFWNKNKECEGMCFCRSLYEGKKGGFPTKWSCFFLFLLLFFCFLYYWEMKGDWYYYFFTYMK